MGREERAGLNCPVQRRAAMLPELKYSRPSADPSSVLTDSLSIPHPRVLARHALPQLLESTLIPLAVFYVVLWTAGVWGALIGALVWSYAALIRRLATGREVPGLLILGVLGLTVRTAISVATGSVFVYFLQPTIGLVVLSAAFPHVPYPWHAARAEARGRLHPDVTRDDPKARCAVVLPSSVTAVGAGVSGQRRGDVLALVQPA